jgi:hypothetical protein
MVPAIIWATMLAAGTVAEPLPDHVDIPDSFSTVICPDQQSAKMMLDRYYGVKPAPKNHIIDTDMFFAGLKATGCAQDSTARKGVITIKAVHQRKILNMADGAERMIRYSGTNAVGTPVVGIVDEDGNNRHARTPLAEWLLERSSNGWLDARIDRGNGWIFYRCDSSAKANAAVTATKPLAKAKAVMFRQRLERAAAQQGCRPASDTYYVTAILSTSGNECGFECYVDLHALAATDRSGLPVGLIFDGSLM